MFARINRHVGFMPRLFNSSALDEKTSGTAFGLADERARSPRTRSSSDVTLEAAHTVAARATVHPEKLVPSRAEQRAVRGPRAEDVPRWKRVLQVVAAVSVCLLSTGIVYGYAALKSVLEAEGAYRLECGGSLTSPVSAAVQACVDLRLDFMFSVAAVGSGVASLPGGMILDRWGPRVCGVLGAIQLMAGTLLMAFASDRNLPSNALVAGYFFLAIGGAFVFISTLHLSNAFPRNAGLIFALTNGAYDASSVLFLAYQLAYSASDASFGPSRFFLAYLTIPAAIITLQFVLQPRYSYQTVIKAPCTATATSLLPTSQDEEAGSAPAPTFGDGPVRDRSGIWGAMHDSTVWRQIFSPWWLLMTAFAVVQSTRLNYFIATIGSQADYLLGAQGDQLNAFFNVALPAGAVVATPFAGLLLDWLSAPWAIGTLVSVATIMGALGAVPSAPAAAYVGVLLFVVYRSFFYSALADYCAKVFGFRTLGTVYGALFLLGGLCNFLQTGLDDLFRRVCAGNPIPVNLFLLAVVAVLGLLWVLFVAYRCNRPAAIAAAAAPPPPSPSEPTHPDRHSRLWRWLRWRGRG